MSDWSSDVCSSDLRHRENLRVVRAWPPPFLRRLRHRALLYQRGDVSGADRRAERDARRPRPDPGAGADPDRRAHRLDGEAGRHARLRTLPALRIATVVIVGGDDRRDELRDVEPGLSVVIALADDHERARRDDHEILAAVAEAAEGVGGDAVRLGAQTQARAISELPLEPHPPGRGDDKAPRDGDQT